MDYENLKPYDKRIEEFNRFTEEHYDNTEYLQHYKNS